MIRTQKIFAALFLMPLFIWTGEALAQDVQPEAQPQVQPEAQPQNQPQPTTSAQLDDTGALLTQQTDLGLGNRLIAYGEYSDGRNLFRASLITLPLGIFSTILGSIVISEAHASDTAEMNRGGLFVGIGVTAMAVGSTLLFVGLGRMFKYRPCVQFEQVSGP